MTNSRVNFYHQLSRDLPRMVSTLQELCYDRIALTIEHAPPLIQEQVLGETMKRLEAKILSRAREDVSKSFNDILPYIVPDIMEDIIYTSTHPGSVRRNYRHEFNNVWAPVMNCAVRVAEEAVRKMEERYIHAAFSRTRY